MLDLIIVLLLCWTDCELHIYPVLHGRTDFAAAGVYGLEKI